jgi:hypothetical protein
MNFLYNHPKDLVHSIRSLREKSKYHLFLEKILGDKYKSLIYLIDYV